MIHQNISARDLEPEFDHCCATWGNHRGLYVRQGRGRERCLIIYSVEDLTDHMEGCSEVWAADTEEDAHSFTNFCLERFLLSQATNRTVEYKVLGVFIEQ